MPSPFPGMNPYLEQKDVWHDFHQRLTSRIAEALTPQIRPAYLAKIDENVYIHELPEDVRFLLGRPDVGVLDAGTSSAAGATATLPQRPPVYGHVQPAADIERLPFIEIRDNERRELVTVIEVLSPTNKKIGPDREQYLGKRQRLLASAVHLVEIDLLRGGPRMPIEKLPQCDYAVMVSRSEERPRVGLWPIRLTDPLPAIPIPLRHGDADATLDLQPLLGDLYDAAGYADYIYRGAPDPPLHPADGAWAEERIGAVPSL